MFDFLIKNGTVIDGTGSEGYRGWIGIQADEISRVGKGECPQKIEADAREIIDAAGKAVSPGFIDIHSHGDLSLLFQPFSPDKVWQGVTTQTIGHCGSSAAPLSDEWRSVLSQSILRYKGIEWEWETFADFATVLGSRELGTNVAPFVGYAPIRAAVLGPSPKEPDRKELGRMKSLVEEAMDSGSFGFTTGLAYPPQCQATTAELASLCEVVAHRGGIYATHVRDIIYDFISGLKEAIEIGRRSGVHVHIAHVQVRPNPYYTLQDVLNVMDEARQAGLEVTCDQYPYLAGQGPLTPLFPAWALGGGSKAILSRLKDREEREKIKEYMRDVVEKYFRWSDIILWSVLNQSLWGRSIQTLAHVADKDPRDTVMDLLLDQGLSIGAIYFGKTEENLRDAAAWPHSVVGTDGVVFVEKLQNHPRTYGTFSRIVRKYVREQKIFSLEEAIHRMSGLTARILGLPDRGVIAEGKKADLLILDPQDFGDTATYEEPVSRAQGLEMVMVNGKIVSTGGEDRHLSAGEVLRLFREGT